MIKCFEKRGINLIKICHDEDEGGFRSYKKLKKYLYYLREVHITKRGLYPKVNQDNKDDRATNSLRKIFFGNGTNLF